VWPNTLELIKPIETSEYSRNKQNRTNKRPYKAVLFEIELSPSGKSMRRKFDLITSRKFTDSDPVF